MKKAHKTIAAVAGTLLISIIMVRCASNGQTRTVAPEGLNNLADVQPSPTPTPATIEQGVVRLSTGEKIDAARSCNPNEADANCNRMTGEALYAVLQDYDTDRVNQAIISARSVAIQEGVQPLDVIRRWQRDLANDYVYEIRNGTGENSRLVRQQLIYRFSIAMLAESVIVREQPMQAIDMPENSIACLMQTKVGVLPGVSCNGR